MPPLNEPAQSPNISFVHSRTAKILAVVSAVLVVIVVLIVPHGNAKAPQRDIETWNGSVFVSGDPTAFAPGNTYAENDTTSGSATDTQVFPLLLFRKPAAVASQHDNIDFEMALSRMLSASARPAPTSSSAVAEIQQLFASIPSFPINFASAQKERPRTPEQTALFAYGNAVGSLIKAYDLAYPDPAPILSDIPASVSAAHADLAHGYQDAGELLSAVGDARDDKTYIAAIEAYDSAADALIQNYGSLVTSFAIAGVTFSSRDGGSVFTFTGAGGL